MAKAKEKSVMAWNGRSMTPTPESQTVQVKHSGLAIDMDGGTMFTPKFARAFFCEGIDRLPTRLLKIDPPGTMRMVSVLEKGAAGTRVYVQEMRPINHWRIELEYPVPCISTIAGPASIWSVAVQNEADARDPYFADLPAQDREAIVAAVMSGGRNEEARS